MTDIGEYKSLKTVDSHFEAVMLDFRSRARRSAADTPYLRYDNVCFRRNPLTLRKRYGNASLKNE